MTTEQGSQKVWKRVEKVHFAYPKIGLIAIFSGRLGSDSSSGFLGGKPAYTSTAMCDYYSVMFKKGYALLPPSLQQCLALIWETAYVHTMTNPPNLQEASIVLAQYHAQATKVIVDSGR
jgi:hypothetical protein